MNNGGSSQRYWLMRIVVIAWIASSAIVVYLLNRLDGVVHGDLYNYGLVFSTAWAVPFWSFERLIYVCLAVPATLGGAILVLDFWRGAKGETPVVKHVSNKSVASESKAPVQAQNAKENSMVVSCPKCQKIFGKPLNMLDFSSGKTRLVNVCPYCNHVLGDSDSEKSVDVSVVETEDQAVQKNVYQNR